MSRTLLVFLLFSSTFSIAQETISSLPVWIETAELIKGKDWLISKVDQKAELYRSDDGKNIIFTNGLLKRSFRIQPNIACIDFSNLVSEEQLLRAVNPEAKLRINGKDYNIGGLYGQTERAYLKYEWIERFKSNGGDFQFRSFNINAITSYVKWNLQTNRWAANRQQPTGKMLTFKFESWLLPLRGVIINVNYELYDGIPLICKWVSVENNTNSTIKIDKIINEILAAPEEESSVGGAVSRMKTPHGLYIESNYAFNNSMNARLSDQTTNWKGDSTFTSQVNYGLQTPCLLEVYPPIGPEVEILPGEIFKSIRTNELLLDSYDRERNGLAQKMMYDKIAPWTTENPIFMHLISIDPKVVRNAIDQCAETGYEGIILSFGSGLDMEDLSEENINKIKTLVDYAHNKDVLLGGYSLFSSRKINDDEDVIDPKTGKADVHALFNHAPCLASRWGINYINKLKEFIKRTGIDLFENDGPYAGDVCASTKHPGHKGLADSQWAQMELQKEFYRWCSKNGIYVNAPDWYFMDGTNKISIGYRERNFSLPREQQILLNRQNIYDGTWEKTPSMSWGFVPLTEYQGGGSAATLEPLADHLYAYEQLMMQYYGAGVQACYRGPRLYDTEETKKLVIKVINWYKKYRAILNAQIVHLRRPDGRDWDGILHVDPHGKEKGLAMLYNPLNKLVNRKIKLPLYYTGLTKKAVVREKEGRKLSYMINGDKTVTVEVSIPANGYTWLVVE